MTADATYQPSVYRKQGGDYLIVASSGVVEVESGGLIQVDSGGSVDLQSGSSFKIATTLEVASGGILDIQSGAYQKVPVQTLGTSQTATAVTNFGASVLTGTTTGPTYTLAAISAAGMLKELILAPTSSGVTNRAVVKTDSTGTSLAGGTTNATQVTLSTSKLWAVSMRSISTTAWRIVGKYDGEGVAARTT